MSGQANTDSPTKRKARATGKRTGGRPTQKLQTSEMRLQTDIPAGTSNNDIIIQQPVPSDNDDQDNDEQSCALSEDIAPSPKRQNKKRTPPAISTAPLRIFTRNSQSSLSTALTLNTTKEGRRRYNLKLIRHRTNKIQTTTQA